MRLIRIMINGQLISWEIECTYGYDRIMVTALTGKDIATEKQGLNIDGIKSLIDKYVDVSAAIGGFGDYKIEPLGKYLLKGLSVDTLIQIDEAPRYTIQLNYEWQGQENQQN